MTGKPNPTRRWRRRRPLVIVLIGALAFGLIAALSYQFWRVSDRDDVGALSRSPEVEQQGLDS